MTTIRGAGVYGGMAPAAVADPGGLALACDRVIAERDAYVAAEPEPEPELEAGL